MVVRRLPQRSVARRKRRHTCADWRVRGPHHCRSTGAMSSDNIAERLPVHNTRRRRASLKKSPASSCVSHKLRYTCKETRVIFCLLFIGHCLFFITRHDTSYTFFHFRMYTDHCVLLFLLFHHVLFFQYVRLAHSYLFLLLRVSSCQTT